MPGSRPGSSPRLPRFAVPHEGRPKPSDRPARAYEHTTAKADAAPPGRVRGTASVRGSTAPRPAEVPQQRIRATAPAPRLHRPQGTVVVVSRRRVRVMWSVMIAGVVLLVAVVATWVVPASRNHTSPSAAQTTMVTTPTPAPTT